MPALVSAKIEATNERLKINYNFQSKKESGTITYNFIDNNNSNEFIVKWEKENNSDIFTIISISESIDKRYVTLFKR